MIQYENVARQWLKDINRLSENHPPSKLYIKPEGCLMFLVDYNETLKKQFHLEFYQAYYITNYFQVYTKKRIAPAPRLFLKVKLCAPTLHAEAEEILRTETLKSISPKWNEICEFVDPEVKRKKSSLGKLFGKGKKNKNDSNNEEFEQPACLHISVHQKIGKNIQP